MFSRQPAWRPGPARGAAVRTRARSSVTRQRNAPGAAVSNGWGAAGSAAIRQRRSAVSNGGSPGPVASSSGVRPAVAASCNRRAAVNGTARTAPTTAAGPRARSPSSSAHSASRAEWAATSSSRAGSTPSAARPGPYGIPNSRSRAVVETNSTAAPVWCRVGSAAAVANASASAAGVSPCCCGCNSTSSPRTSGMMELPCSRALPVGQGVNKVAATGSTPTRPVGDPSPHEVPSLVPRVMPSSCSLSALIVRWRVAPAVSPTAGLLLDTNGSSMFSLGVEKCMMRTPQPRLFDGRFRC